MRALPHRLHHAIKVSPRARSSSGRCSSRFKSGTHGPARHLLGGIGRERGLQGRPRGPAEFGFAPDSPLEEAVSSEPVSGSPDSLLPGKIQRNFGDRAVEVQRSPYFLQAAQWLTEQFLNKPNREILVAEQGKELGHQGKLWPNQGNHLLGRSSPLFVNARSRLELGVETVTAALTDRPRASYPGPQPEPRSAPESGLPRAGQNNDDNTPDRFQPRRGL
jgi:hypothetical protein